jgi:hypothetical protein
MRSLREGIAMKDPIGSLRVSTREPCRSGLEPAAQRFEIEAFGAGAEFSVKSCLVASISRAGCSSVRCIETDGRRVWLCECESFKERAARHPRAFALTAIAIFRCIREGSIEIDRVSPGVAEPACMRTQQRFLHPRLTPNTFCRTSKLTGLVRWRSIPASFERCRSPC